MNYFSTPDILDYTGFTRGALSEFMNLKDMPDNYNKIVVNYALAGMPQSSFISKDIDFPFKADWPKVPIQEPFYGRIQFYYMVIKKIIII